STSFQAREREPRRSAGVPPIPVLLAISSVLAAAGIGGCVLAPAGLREERDRLSRAGAPFEAQPPAREMPELPPTPGWRELLARAFAANGDLEADYFEWKAALDRVRIAAGYPNTNLAPSFSYLFSGDHLKAWD